MKRTTYRKLLAIAILVGFVAASPGRCDVVFRVPNQTAIGDGLNPTIGFFPILIDVSSSAVQSGVAASVGSPVTSWDFEALDVVNVNGITSVTIDSQSIEEGDLFAETLSAVSIVRDFSFGSSPLTAAGFSMDSAATLDHGDSLLNIPFSVPAGEFGTFDIEFSGQVGVFDDVGHGQEYANVSFASAAIISIVSEVELSGDYNRNDRVEGSDLLLWQREFGLTGNDLAADGDGNNVVDIADLGLWQASYGQQLGPLNALVVAVPEPTAIVLLLAGIIFLGFFSRQRAMRTPRSYAGCTSIYHENTSLLTLSD